MQPNIPTHVQKTIREELHPFERVLFTAQPIPAQVATQAWTIWLFAIPWTAFAFFWTYMASEPLRKSANGTDPLFSVIFPLFGLPFILIGLAMLASPLWALKTAKRMFYVLTSERALIITAGKATKIESIPVAQMTEPTTTIRSDGSGNLIFREMEEIPYRRNRYYHRRPKGFIGLPDVREAKRQLEKLREGSKSSEQSLPAVP